jgi:hypothetical protein
MCAFLLCAVVHAGAAPFQISNTELQNKIKGGWLGKTAGVCIGGPTEFLARDSMYNGPINFFPDLDSGLQQDDMYVQVTFISAMDAKLNGRGGIFEATQIDYANAFNETTYPLWWANEQGRTNIRNNIMPPLSGMWACSGSQYNPFAEAIDFQIDCDWIGIMCPAMPITAIRLCDSVGQIMSYGNGLYGGYYVCALEALAFQYHDIHTVVREAIKCIPDSSDYAGILRDVISFHDNNPGTTYADCWQYINPKWVAYKSSPCIVGNLNFTALFNGALFTIGLLYGDNDALKTIEYVCRGGQDSDCNPASAGAVIGIMLGYDALADAWKSTIGNGVYAGSAYTYDHIVASHMARSKMCIAQLGGDTSASTFTINAEAPAQPKTWEQFGFAPQPATAVASERKPLLLTHADMRLRYDKNRGILFSQNRTGRPKISLYDVRGRQIFAAQGNSGNGRGDCVVLPGGKNVPSHGCYIARVQLDGAYFTVKCPLVRY